MHQELSELILFKISDPRLVGVNVTDVTVDREFAYADVYVSAVEGSIRSKGDTGRAGACQWFSAPRVGSAGRIAYLPQAAIPLGSHT